MKKSTEYKPGETVESMEKTFTKVCDACIQWMPRGSETPEKWQDPDLNDYTPTSGFAEGTALPEFVPVVD